MALRVGDFKIFPQCMFVQEATKIQNYRYTQFFKRNETDFYPAKKCFVFVTTTITTTAEGRRKKQ